MPLSSSNSFLKSLFQNLQNTVRRGKDVSRNVVLNGALIPLTEENCISVTVINTTGSDLNVSVNNTVPVIIPDKAGVTLDVENTSEVSVSGSGTLSYIVSK